MAPTPPHPEYPAGHGCASQALASTLTAFFGTDHLPLTVFSAVTQTTHYYATFSALVAEVDAARIYGGMHYPHSTLQGNKLGRLVVEQMLAKYFRP